MKLVGNAANDVLSGGDGGDIHEGCDDDHMTGGAGTDMFVFHVLPTEVFLSPEAGDGHDMIQDLHVGEDQLLIRGGMADLKLRFPPTETIARCPGGPRHWT